MSSDNQQGIYFEDGEYRVYCDICDGICTARYHKNHIKSKTYTNNFRKRDQLKKSFQIFSPI